MQRFVKLQRKREGAAQAQSCNANAKEQRKREGATPTPAPPTGFVATKKLATLFELQAFLCILSLLVSKNAFSLGAYQQAETC